MAKPTLVSPTAGECIGPTNIPSTVSRSPDGPGRRDPYVGNSWLKVALIGMIYAVVFY